MGSQEQGVLSNAGAVNARGPVVFGGEAAPFDVDEAV
jgi:hypothetical protein